MRCLQFVNPDLKLRGLRMLWERRECPEEGQRQYQGPDQLLPGVHPAGLVQE